MAVRAVNLMVGMICFSMIKWIQAFEETGIDPAFMLIEKEVMMRYYLGIIFL